MHFIINATLLKAQKWHQNNDNKILQASIFSACPKPG